MAHTLTLRLQPWELSIIKLDSHAGCDVNAGAFLSFLRGPQETSLVVETAHVPANALARNDGWVCFEVLGPLDFSLTGIIAGISETLARAQISIFAISSFDTDFILVKQAQQPNAVQALTQAGYVVDV